MVPLIFKNKLYETELNNLCEIRPRYYGFLAVSSTYLIIYLIYTSSSPLPNSVPPLPLACMSHCLLVVCLPSYSLCRSVRPFTGPLFLSLFLLTGLYLLLVQSEQLFLPVKLPFRSRFSHGSGLFLSPPTTLLGLRT